MLNMLARKSYVEMLTRKSSIEDVCENVYVEDACENFNNKVYHDRRMRIRIMNILEGLLFYSMMSCPSCLFCYEFQHKLHINKV